MEFVAYVLSLIALAGVFILWVEIRELKETLYRKPKPKQQPKQQPKAKQPITVNRAKGYFDNKWQ
jgi:hypothetical protein